MEMDQKAWCYDVRSNWSNIEDVVLTEMEGGTEYSKAVATAGYTHKLVTLEKDDVNKCVVYRRDASDTSGIPEYYIQVDLDDNAENLNAANFPSLPTVLRDVMQVFQIPPVR